MAAPIVGVLGTQIKPAATTVTAIYTVPSARRARVRIMYTNQHASTADAVSVWISVNGASAAVADKILHQEAIAAVTSAETPPIIVSDTDVIRVESQNGDVSFTCNGYEDDIPT